MNSTRALVLALVCASALAAAVCVSGAPAGPSVLALDFGSEWAKGCLANQKPSTIGTHLDVVINEQSSRKTPNILGFDADGDRILGDSALPLLFRSPAAVYPQIKRLLGKTLADPATARFAADFPALKLEAAADRSTLQFAPANAKSAALTVEEIAVTLLQLAKRQAENHVAANAEPEDVGPVTQVVLTVPEHWTVGQRTLLSQLAQLAGFDAPKAVLGELTAAAIDFSVRNVVTPGKTRVAFLGAGTLGVSAALVELERVGEVGAADAEIRVKVLRTASDESIGGYSFDVLLRDELAKKFDATQKAGAVSITTNPRAMAKLLREARDLKEMLSVSPTIDTTMEELFAGRDFKTTISQEELVGWSRELVQKLIAPLRTVLEGEAPGAVVGVEIFGGAVRIPAVQAALKESFPSIPLGKHVDGDEGALVGAAHYAGVQAGITKLLRVVVDESAALVAGSSAADAALALSPAQESVLRARIAALDAKAESRRAADAARNDLESALNDARDLQSQAPKSKRAEADALETLIASASTFVDDADKSTSAADFTSQLTTLREAMKPLQAPKKPVVAEKPSAPRKKRDRRAEHKRAMDEAARQAKAKKPQKSDTTQTKAQPKAQTKAQTKAPEKTAKGKGKNKDEL